MKIKYGKWIAVNVVLMVVLMAAIIGVTSQRASAEEPSGTVRVAERGDCVAKYNGVAERLRNAVAAGELTEEQARAKLVAFRQELGKSCNTSKDTRDQYSERVAIEKDDRTDQARDGKREGEKREDGSREFETIANMIGIDVRSLLAELKAGSSIADVAEANGVDSQTIIEALVVEAQAGIDEKAAQGGISAEEAAEWSAKLEERFTYYVNESAAAFEKDGNGEHEKREDGMREFETIANLIGIDLRALLAELKAGSSIADVAEANGVDPQTIINALVADAQADIDAAAAEGKISAEEAADWSAKLEERFSYSVNESATAFEKDGKGDREKSK